MFTIGKKLECNMKKQDVISYFGSVKATAAALGITSQAVSQWPDRVPKESQKTIFIVTQGRLQMEPGIVPNVKHDRSTKKQRAKNQVA